MPTTSFSRLGSANTYDNTLRNLAARQASLSNLQEQLTSGKKVVAASDDPTGAGQSERALMRISRIAADQRALENQRNSIVLAESTLGDATNALQTFRELVVSAGNGSNGPAERQAIAIQLSGLRDQIFGYANRKDTNGLPLFAALGSALTPFVGPNALPQDYTYQGLPGQTASTQTAIASTLDGESAFMHQPSRDGVYNVSISPVGATLRTTGVTVSDSALVTDSAYTLSISAVDTTTVPGTTTVTYDITENPAVSGAIPSVTVSVPTSSASSIPITGVPGLSLSLSGKPGVGDTLTLQPSPSLFSVLDNAIRDIGNAANGTQASQAISQALHNVDIGMSRLSAVRGQAGDLLTRADRISSNQEARSVQLQADRSRAEDLDMAAGISAFQNQQTGYQAALQSYAQVQKLSLFNYIG
jgi:flagellar hook-associated protein 3 FlgL